MPKHQQDEAWLEARRGMITASRFHCVMTKPRSKADKEAGNLSATAQQYMFELLGEVLTGIPAGIPTTKSMQWGIDHEDDARIEYSLETGQHVVETGFLTIPGTWIGCSPDGLVGDDGGIEIKCPYTTANHIKWMRDGIPSEYLWQCVGAMVVTDRKWWDFVSYDPRINGRHRLHIQRIHRDERCDQLLDALIAFNDKFYSLLQEFV